MINPFFHSYFSPGEECREAICTHIREARKTIDICVFTISDNVITHAILDAHNSGIKVRIISDNDKVYDRGSDIYWLAREGVEIKIDHTHHHMHHKFVVFDNKILLTGSYNWTRSAADFNHENIIVTNTTEAAIQFSTEFERLWQIMDPLGELHP